MVSHVRLAILATMADGPCELIQDQTSDGQSLGNGMAEGLSRTVPENHNTAA